MTASSSRWRVLLITGLAVVLSLSTWFSATAVAPEIARDLQLSSAQTVWLTNGVQAGFVIGALLSSFFAWSDIWPMKWILAIGAIGAGIANALILNTQYSNIAGISRFATGLSLALVYPTAMKYIGTWFVKGRGLAMGGVVGALTLGSAFPHLVRAVGIGFDWKFVIIATSLASLVAALIFLTLKDGPQPFKSAKFELKQLKNVTSNRASMLANFGYFGHMWELYAMWGWFLAYVSAAKLAGLGIVNLSLITFAVIGVGAFGCLLGGWMADRIGRCYTSALAMGISGTCAVLIGFVYTGPVVIFVMIAIIWGISVIADSAQFSAAVSEVSDQSLVGASLAFQMGCGFTIAIMAVWLTPVVAEALGSWRWTFSILAIGPLIGIWSMLTLRKNPDSIKMANGNR